jgi:hypothetical protein
MMDNRHIILSEEEEMKHALDSVMGHLSDIDGGAISPDQPLPHPFTPRQYANRKARRAMAKKSRQKNRRRKTK